MGRCTRRVCLRYRCWLAIVNLPKHIVWPLRYLKQYHATSPYRHCLTRNTVWAKQEFNRWVCRETRRIMRLLCSPALSAVVFLARKYGTQSGDQSTYLRSYTISFQSESESGFTHAPIVMLPVISRLSVLLQLSWSPEIWIFRNITFWLNNMTLRHFTRLCQPPFLIPAAADQRTTIGASDESLGSFRKQKMIIGN